MHLEKQLDIYVNIAYKHSGIMGDFFSFSIAFFFVFSKLTYLYFLYLIINVYYFIIGKI